MELWRTGFWKDKWIKEKIERKQRLDEGLNGLWEAGVALRWSDIEQKHPIDFTKGAVGLPGERLLLRRFVADAIKQAQAKFKEKWRKYDVFALHP